MEDMKFVLEFEEPHEAIRVLEKLLADGDMVIKLKDRVYVISEPREVYVTVSFISKTKTLDVEVAEDERAEISS